MTLIYISIYLVIIALFIPALIKTHVIKPVSLKETGIIVALAALSVIFINIVMKLADILNVADLAQYNNQMANSFETTIPVAAEVLVTAMLAPILEELLFRFTMIGLLKKVSKSVPNQTMFCVVVSAIFFGLLHQVTYQQVYAIFSGLILGALYCYEFKCDSGHWTIKENKNLVRPTLFHMTVNLIGCITYYLL